MAHTYSHYNIVPFVQSSHDLPRLEHQQSDLRVSTNEVIRQKFHAHVPTSIELPIRVRTYNLCGCMVCATDIHSCHVRYMATMNIRTTFHAATKVALLWLLFYS